MGFEVWFRAHLGAGLGVSSGMDAGTVMGRG